MSVEAMTWVLEHARKRDGSRLGPSLKMILLGIANHADKFGDNAWPGLDTLADYADLSVDQTRRNLRSLESEGLIETTANAGGTHRTRGDRRPNLYRLPAMNDPAPMQARDDERPRVGDGHDPAPSAERPRVGAGGTVLNHPEEPSGEASLPNRVRRVFDFWVEHLDHPRAVLDDKRRKRIEWALKTYPARDVADAILGIAASPYHRGDNETGAKYDDITLVFRDATHLERFRDLYRTPPTPRGKNGRQPRGALDEVARRDAETAAARYS